jgi:hypothetical protein
MILTNKVYDVLKWITLVLLPSLSVLYLAMAQVWNLPYSTEVASTLAAIDVFLAVLLGISTNTFKVGNPMYRLNLVKLAGDFTNTWIMSTQVYDILTWVAQIFLPAAATLYAALSGVWGLPYAEQVVGTIVAIDTFLGLLLGFSTAEFHKKVAQACVVSPEAWTNLPD